MTYVRSLFFISTLLLVPSAFAQEPSGEQTFEARITSIEERACTSGTGQCEFESIERSRGNPNGETIVIESDPADALSENDVQYRKGMRIIVQSQENNGERVYFISDVVRRTPLAWLGLLFIAAVFLFGGLHALRSFLGLIVSFAVLLLFILPRILAGDSPVIVALVGSFIIMAITFLLSHGWNRKTIAAFAGTGSSLVLTAILAAGFSAFALLTGTADEEVLFLLADFPAIDTRGVLLAGIIIGSLGVLDDITISQSSAVFELRRANKHLTLTELYRSACRIGADHIAAAVNTLVLAYAGTALPLLLLLGGIPSGESWFTFINREMIAGEIVRTLVGSIGPLAAVPPTTFIASYLALHSKEVDRKLQKDVHHHAH